MLVIVLLRYVPSLVSNICFAANVIPLNVVLLEICNVFALLNSSLNPFVYFWRKRDLRAQAKQLSCDEALLSSTITIRARSKRLRCSFYHRW